MDLVECRQKNAASRAKVEALLAERHTAAHLGKSRQPANKLKQLQRRHTRLADRQLPQFHASIAIPSGTARPLPLPPRLARQIGDAVAQSGAMVRLQGHSIRLERRGQEIPRHVVELVASHASAIAETLRQHRCRECDRGTRIQSAPDSTAGASWQLACPACGDVIHP